MRNIKGRAGGGGSVNIIHRTPSESRIFLRNFLPITSLLKPVRDRITRRAGGSETTQWSQPGNREAVLRGLRGVPKESGVPPNSKR